MSQETSFLFSPVPEFWGVKKPCLAFLFDCLPPTDPQIKDNYFYVKQANNINYKEHDNAFKNPS